MPPTTTATAPTAFAAYRDRLHAEMLPALPGLIARLSCPGTASWLTSANA